MKEPLDSPPGAAPLGKQIPDLSHALSVSLPTWQDNIGWASGSAAVVDVMKTGYPRFFVHRSILQLTQICLEALQNGNDKAMLFPTLRAGEECVKYMVRLADKDSAPSSPRIAPFVVEGRLGDLRGSCDELRMGVVAVMFPPELWKLAKSFWQNTGMGISSRYAERIIGLIREGNSLEIVGSQSSISIYPSALEEKSILRERISTLVNGHTKSSESALNNGRSGVGRRYASENDVYLYPTGMSAIWHSHRLALCFKPERKCICFGFSYTDTIKVLERWGPGSIVFFEDPESNLKALEEFLTSPNRDQDPATALFCEFPSNPLLQSPNLPRLRELADKHGFLIIIDETVGGFVNVDVLQYADIITTSMSKLFSGSANVMGGSLVLNSNSQHYDFMKRHMKETYVDDYYFEDAIVMEGNSRDFALRVDVINSNANAVCEYLRTRSLAWNPELEEEGLVIKDVFYPKWVTRQNYDLCRRPHAENNFGPLFSLTFTSPQASHAFYNALKCAKGPSLGTNFTLACPYTILAHYNERPWVAGYGIEEGIVRVSVGMEDPSLLMEWFECAVDAAEDAGRDLK